MTHTIEEIERLMAEATPGPWKVTEDTSAAQVKGHPIIESAECEIVGSEGFFGKLDTDWANAALIVAAVNALPELLERVKRLEEALALVLVLVEADQWRPIDWSKQDSGAAPFDGKPVLMLGKPLTDCLVPIWQSGGWGKSGLPGNTFRGEATYGRPTHWRPLPKEPAQ